MDHNGSKHPTSNTKGNRSKDNPRQTRDNRETLSQVIPENEGQTDRKENLIHEELERTLSQRAAMLACELETEEPGEQIEIARFRLGREVYGLDVNNLIGIRPLRTITRVPNTPNWIAGVINLRGRTFSVLDLQRFLNLQPLEQTGKGRASIQHLIMVETSDMEMAILVDEVQAIDTLPVKQIQEANSSVRGIPSEYVRGIFLREGNHSNQTQADRNRHEPWCNSTSSMHEGESTLVVILDLPAIFADKRLIIHEDIV